MKVFLRLSLIAFVLLLLSIVVVAGVSLDEFRTTGWSPVFVVQSLDNVPQDVGDPFSWPPYVKFYTVATGDPTDALCNGH